MMTTTYTKKFKEFIQEWNPEGDDYIVGYRSLDDSEIRIPLLAVDNSITANKYIRKDIDDYANGIINFTKGFTVSGNVMSTIYLQGLDGWMGTRKGDFEMNSLTLREFLEVPELRKNRITVMGNQFWFTDSAMIKEVNATGSGNYNVYFKLEDDEYAPFELNDILKGIYHYSNGFWTVYLKVYELILNPDTLGEIGIKVKAMNSRDPRQSMLLARINNSDNIERQGSIFADGLRRYIRVLYGYDSEDPTSEGSIKSLKVQMGDLSTITNHPIFGNLEGYGLYADNVYLTGKLIVKNDPNQPGQELGVYRGTWDSRSNYYKYDQVTYKGSLYTSKQIDNVGNVPTGAIDDIWWELTVSKGDDGTSGEHNITLELTNDNHNIPTDSEGKNPSYGGASSSAHVYQGTLDITDVYTITASLEAPITADKLQFIQNDNSVTITFISDDVDAAAIKFTATATGYPTISKIWTITKVKSGIPGNDATAYWLVTDSPVIKKHIYNVSGSEVVRYEPSPFVIRAFSQTGTNAIMQYDGYIRLKYGSQVQVVAGSTYQFTPAADVTSYTIELFQEVGLTTLLDKEIVTVVSDGRVPDWQTYIFKASAAIPAKPTYTTPPSTFPTAEGWEDYPKNSTSVWWMSTASINGVTNVVSSWSSPVKATGEDGLDGANGVNGIDIVWKGDFATPPLNPQLNWVYRDTGNGRVYIWNGTIWALMVLDGTDGEDGTNGTNGLSVFITYHDNNIYTVPATPTGNGTTGGWHTAPTKTCVWMSQKVSNTSTEGSWGTPIRLRGEDGGYVDFKYALNTSAVTAPTIVVTDRQPVGWSDVPPVVPTGSYLWMTVTKINPDNTLDGTWSKPVRINGEKGDTGATGPTGAQGLHGVDGLQGPSITFAGVWSGSTQYYGYNTTQTCVVYNNKYYYTKTVSPELSPVTIPTGGVNNPSSLNGKVYWNEFVGQFSNIATGLLLAERIATSELTTNKLFIVDRQESSGNIIAADGSIITKDEEKNLSPSQIIGRLTTGWYMDQGVIRSIAVNSDSTPKLTLDKSGKITATGVSISGTVHFQNGTIGNMAVFGDTGWQTTVNGPFPASSGFYYLRKDKGVTITPEGHIIGKDYFLTGDSAVGPSVFIGDVYVPGSSVPGSDNNALSSFLKLFNSLFERVLIGEQYLIKAKLPLFSIGDIVAYGSDGMEIPSLWDGIPVDKVTIDLVGGKLKVIGGTGGIKGIVIPAMTAEDALVGASLNASGDTITFTKGTFATKAYVTWANIAGKPNTLAGYGITDSILSTDVRLTNARPASDVYTWAKAATKPSYAFSEITGAPPIPDLTPYVKKTGDVLTGELRFTLGNRHLVMGPAYIGFKISDTNTGWAQGFNFMNAGGTMLGAFSAHGIGQSLRYLYAGLSYDNWWMKITPSVASFIDAIESPNFTANVNGVHAQTSLYLPNNPATIGYTDRPRFGRFDRDTNSVVLQLGSTNSFEIIDSAWSRVAFKVNANNNATNVVSISGNHPSGTHLRINNTTRGYGELGVYETLGTYLQSGGTSSLPTLCIGRVDNLDSALSLRYNNVFYDVVHSNNYQQIVFQNQKSLDLSSYDSSKWYPCWFLCNSYNGVKTRLVINNVLRGNKPTWGTHGNGFSLYVDMHATGSAWGGINHVVGCDEYSAAFGGETAFGGTAQNAMASTQIIWLRGGAIYYYKLNINGNLVSSLNGYHWASSGYVYDSNPRTIQGTASDGFGINWISAYSLCNVASATKLQTARSIYGNSFDGTGDCNGIFRNVIGGSASWNIVHKILFSPTSSHGLITRINGGSGDVSLQAERESNANETFRLILNPTGGNVGIGDLNPVYKLEVSGTCRISNVLVVKGSTANYNEGIRLVGAAGTWSNIQFGAAEASGGLQSAQWCVGKNPSNVFVIASAGNQSGTATWQSGNVLIDAAGSIKAKDIVAHGGVKTTNICIETNAAGAFANTSEINNFTGNIYVQYATGGKFVANAGGGISEFRGRVHVNSALHSPDAIPTISLAIGDNDTGFRWRGDGSIGIMANNIDIAYWNTTEFYTYKATYAPSLNIYVGGNALHLSANTVGWKYIRYKISNTSNFWDIATTSNSAETDLPNTFQVRFNGSDTNKLSVNANGTITTTSFGRACTFGAVNASYCHYITTAASHYFNKYVTVDGDILPYGTNTFVLGTAGNRWKKMSIDQIDLYGRLMFTPINVSDNWTTVLQTQAAISHSSDISCNDGTSQLVLRWQNMNQSGYRTTYVIGSNRASGFGRMVLWIGNSNAQNSGNGLILNANGAMTWTGSFTTATTINSGARITSGSDILSNGWVRTTGATGWYSESYGGGICMTDSTWVRTYGGKQFYVDSRNVSAIHTMGGVNATGRGYFGGYIRAGGYVSAGEGDDNQYGFINVCRTSTIVNASYFSMVRSGVHAVGIGVDTSGSVIIGSCNNNKTINPFFAVYSTGISVYGNVLASGEITAFSDVRLKSNISNLSFRGKLIPKTYIKDGKQSIGFIAQDVQQLYPELVHIGSDENHYLSLNYGNISAVLAAQLNLVDDEVTMLKRRVAELENTIHLLQKQYE